MIGGRRKLIKAGCSNMFLLQMEGKLSLILLGDLVLGNRMCTSELWHHPSVPVPGRLLPGLLIHPILPSGKYGRCRQSERGPPGMTRVKSLGSMVRGLPTPLSLESQI